MKKLAKSTKNEAERQRFDIQQKALKLVANSMYGCLGFQHSRFYCKPLAQLITALGRESLMKAAEIANNIGNGIKVIYGDTDSIFIYTDTNNLLVARKYAQDIKRQVNKTYSKMYIELDYVYKKMLLLRKKKYAALKVISHDVIGNVAKNIKTEKEIKGLDLVRRDWSIISKEIGTRVLDIILSEDQACDDVIVAIQELLADHRSKSDKNEIALKQYIITKKLTKAPKDYPDPTKHAHAMVTMAMNDKLGMNAMTGSYIEYVVCTQPRNAGDSSAGSKSGVAQRAYHVKEIETAQPALIVDKEWYLEQQILPPIGRLCEPIEGTDMGMLAHSLGLDSNKFNHLKSNAQMDADSDDDLEDKILRITNPLQKYSQICTPLKVKCAYCKAQFDFGGVFDFRKLDGKCGLICPTPHCKGLIAADVDMKLMQNSLQLQIWHFVYKYYARDWICCDLSCDYKTRQLPLNGTKCPKLGCSATLKETYSASALFDQLRYFAFLFDVGEQRRIKKIEEASNATLKQTRLTKQQEITFNKVHKWIKQTILEKSRYYFIDSKVIFKYLM